MDKTRTVTDRRACHHRGRGLGRCETCDDGECPTCLGVGRIRDGETDDLRKCLDCGGTGKAARP